jgi:predicted dienelactone hydrolase
MRPLELLIPILLITYLVWSRPRPLTIRLLPALALFANLLHFALEGYRWQMIPLYALTPLLALTSLIKLRSSNDWKPAASYLMVLLVAIGTTLPALLPIPRIPAPSGPYQIGTSILELTDDSRAEIYSGKDEPRRFMIQIWYPADVKAGDERAPWMANAEIYAPAVATYIDLPFYFLDHLALVEIPAYKNAAVAATNEPFPIILFSHGWNGFNAQNTGQALELASRGFIVIGLQHTYGAVTTVFPDGTIAPNNPTALPERSDDPNYEEVARVLVGQWAGDMSFLLDQLSRWNEAGENPFFEKLDLSRIGAYGHSTGGGGVIQFCGTDPRCKAVLGMDPFMRPVSAEVIAGGIAQPSFYMFSESWYEITDSKNNKLFSQFYPSAGDSYGVIGIAGTKHFDFSDLPLLSPIAPQLGLKGPLNGARVTEIMNAYLVEFFESTLLGKASDLFNGAFKDFTEIQKLR